MIDMTAKTLGSQDEYVPIPAQGNRKCQSVAGHTGDRHTKPTWPQGCIV
jgi:hypothetical protein